MLLATAIFHEQILKGSVCGIYWCSALWWQITTNWTSLVSPSTRERKEDSLPLLMWKTHSEVTIHSFELIKHYENTIMIIIFCFWHPPRSILHTGPKLCSLLLLWSYHCLWIGEGIVEVHCLQLGWRAAENHQTEQSVTVESYHTN